MRSSIKPPLSYWIVAVFALLWDILEIYYSSFELDFLKANATAEEFEKVQSLPLWYVIVFMVGLFSEILGTLMLFIRKKVAVQFFGLALITLVFIELYWLLAFDIQQTSALFSIVIPVLVIAVAAFLYFYSRKARAKGWLA